MKRFAGKYGTGNRRAVEAHEAQQRAINALPLSIRKVIKERDQACARLNEMARGEIDREAYTTQRQTYDALVRRVNAMIKEHHDV